MKTTTTESICPTSSSRVPWHDYGNGTYFVCFQLKNNHSPIFVGIANNEVHLTDIGNYASYVIENTHLHNPYSIIIYYKILPTSIIIVLTINAEKVPYNRRIRRNSLLSNNIKHTIDHKKTSNIKTIHNIINPEMKELSDCKGWLSVTIGNIKSEISKIAKRKGILFTWEKSFNDHIIKNEEELNSIIEHLSTLPNYRT